MKIWKVFLIMAVLSIISLIVFFEYSKIGFGDLFSKISLQDNIKQTQPFALKLQNEEAVRTSSMSMDYYISSDSLSVIYSFEAKAGVDLKTDAPVVRNDSVFLPYPKILSVDQNDNEKPWILMQKADVHVRDIKPYKIAIEKMTKDYAISSELRDRSADYLKEYFESMDTMYHYSFLPSDSHNKTSLVFPSSSVLIDYYPELLSSEYSFETDSLRYDRYEVICFSKGKPRFTLSYLYNYVETFDEIKKLFAGQGYLYIYDDDPLGKKLLCINKDFAYVFMDGHCYLADRYPMNDDDYYESIMPDMIYLLSCMQIDTKRHYDSNYERWTYDYDLCLEQINKGYFSKALSTLEEMSKFQHGRIGQDEGILTGLCTLLSGKNSVTASGCTEFDNAVEEYIKLFDGDNTYYKDGDNRARILKATKEIHPLHEVLEGYFIKQYGWNQDYLNDYIESGTFADQEIIQAMDSKSYLSYLKSMWRQSTRESQNVDGTNLDFEQVFPSNTYDSNSNIMFMRDFYNVSKDNNNYGSDNEIIRRLSQKGLVPPQTDDPMLIFVFQQQHYNRGIDQDALVFTKDSLLFFANYNGKRAQQGYWVHYSEADISSDCEYLQVHEKEKFKIHAPITVNLVKKLKDAYSRSDSQSLEYMKAPYQNYVISLANKHLSIFTFDTEPIDYQVKQ